VITHKKRKSGYVKHESLLVDEYREIFDNKITEIDNKFVKEINFSFDRSCNFKCPSCRTDYIVANTDRMEKIQLTIDEIENAFSESVELLYISGTADAFASPSYRKYLKNFNPNKYPKLKNIHLHTNGSLWTKSMWDSMPTIHKYVKSCEISIDAGTKLTYENETRIGGNWDVLIENLKYISTIDTIRDIKVSFVVQNSNYKEMRLFYDIIDSIFTNKIDIFYGRITNWGTYSEDGFNHVDVANVNHENHEDFLSEFNKIHNLPNVSHNLHEFVKINKTLI
jgi:MoaA/NifB/PqqE/SkfB family radical SAM enzyme